MTHAAISLLLIAVSRELPPPQQKPTTPNFGLTKDWLLRKAIEAVKSASISGCLSELMAWVGSAGGANLGVPPSRESKSTPSATYPRLAMRRVTSWMWSVSPRFSWITMTAGHAPLPFGLASRADILVSPLG